MSKKKSKRPVKSYLEAAEELRRFVPSLRKYKKRKKLKPHEKSHIAYWDNIIRYTDYLIPVTKKQAKELKNILYRPETLIKSGSKAGQLKRHTSIMAVQMRNVGHDARILKKVEDNIFIESNHRLWVYWQLPDTTKGTLKQYGEKAFTDPASYDIERVIELAKKAFDRPETKGVYLWAESGRVGNPMPTLRDFITWIATDYSAYKNTDRWVRGIAILVADSDEQISLDEWSSFGRKQKSILPRRKRWRRR